MVLYRHNLPQLGRQRMVCDGGMETTLIYQEGVDLPEFAAFTLLQSAQGIDILKRYYDRFAHIAKQHNSGLMLETPTWRANLDWAIKLGLSADELASINRRAIHLLTELRAQWSGDIEPIVIGGVIGPRGDGYRPDKRMSRSEAKQYHSQQITIFADTEADLLHAYTLNYVEEAIGIALAAQAVSMPVALSFTLETDGKLPTGQTLQAAVEMVDKETGSYPAYYQINCAHPSHFEHIFQDGGAWLDRIRGVRANASSKSHAELDASTTLDEGNPLELGNSYKLLSQQLRKLSLIGGCCGTDHRHVAAMCAALG